MLKRLGVTLGLALLLGGCADSSMISSQQTPSIPTKQVSDHDLNQQQLSGLLWMQRAAEYRALCYQAFNIAHERVNQALNQDHDKPLAVIVDIDETVLNNTPYQAWLLDQDHGFSNQSWHRWVKSAQATAIPGALGFLNYVSENGIQVFYITNRQDSEKQPTLTNLKQLGFPNADASHLLMRTTTSNKGARRYSVHRQFDIAVYLGDNLADFSSQFGGKTTEQRNDLTTQNQSQWGAQFIILPNPIYGGWESALIHYNGKASTAEKDRLRRQALLPWHP
ncbi:5'-nucleotidase, lipoprotein e(P4) family [Celerinatantimonas sp. YJH-8]|uniref:5'-nucleotidase, lipoprotein e(P4) family n=1 Tax=Celerinatantimonas sp. YJH-8 TaxID=3228714 RepID=UPI0038BEFF06